MSMMPIVILDDDETAQCPTKDCTYNNLPNFPRDWGYYASVSEDGTICAVYCPYCRAHLKITKRPIQPVKEEAP